MYLSVEPSGRERYKGQNASSTNGTDVAMMMLANFVIALMKRGFRGRDAKFVPERPIWDSHTRRVLARQYNIENI